MLLRSVMGHLKDQNWAAVGIDFVIVVVGVFIGLQVDDWNEARKDRADAKLYLERIRAYNGRDTQPTLRASRGVPRRTGRG